MYIALFFNSFWTINLCTCKYQFSLDIINSSQVTYNFGFYTKWCWSSLSKIPNHFKLNTKWKNMAR